MSKAGKRLIAAAEEAVAIAKGEAQPERTYIVWWEGGIAIDCRGEVVDQWSRDHAAPIHPETGED